MSKLITRGISAARGLALATLLTGAAAAPAAAQTAYALTADLTGAFSLATFQLATPGTFTATVAITGLAAGQDLVGIDIRPATGQLFTLGYNDGATTNNAQLYSLSTTGALTAVGSVLTLSLGSDATRVGFDFNPTVDRIRVTAVNGANYRLNPANGTIANTDTNLAYATGDANAGQTPGVASSAYTNSYNGSTTTTLYDLDEAASRLVRQDPPNNGTLNTVGALGVSTNGALQASDIDIYYNPTTGQNVAYLSVATANLATFSISNQLYSLNLTTGAATAARQLGPSGTLVGVGDIAISVPTGVVTATRATELATDYTLAPNPLAGSTSLSFGLPRAARVELLVTDALGRTVDRVDAGLLPAGAQTIRWERGGQAAGLYFFGLRFDGQPAGTRQAAITQ